MNKVSVYLIIFVLVFSSIGSLTSFIDNSDAEKNPPIGGFTDKIWVIESGDTIVKSNQVIWTRGIMVKDGGYLEFRNVTLYNKGDISVYKNATYSKFNIISSTIYLNGSNFNVSGIVDFEQSALVCNGSDSTVPEIMVQADGFFNVSRSIITSNNTAKNYNFTYEANSNGYINHSRIRNVGIDTGIQIKSSNIIIEDTVFRDNYNHFDILDASPMIKNSSLYGGGLGDAENKEIIINGPTSEVHIVSTWFNITNVQINDGELHEDLFVIVDINNLTKGLGVGNANVTVKDVSSATVAIRTTAASGPGIGTAEAVRCNKLIHNATASSNPLNPYSITANDWDQELLESTIIDINASATDSNLLIHLPFVFDFLPMIDTYTPAITVVENIPYQMFFFYHDLDYLVTNPAEINLTTNSSYVTYMPAQGQLIFDYPDGSPAFSVVNVTIADENLIPNKAYVDIAVAFTPVEDEPSVNVTGSQSFDVYEDKPFYVPLVVTDIDTPISNVGVFTNRSQYFTYISSNTTLRVLYDNGFGPDAKQDDVEVWARDISTNSSAIKQVKLLITFHQTPDAPVITGPVAPQVMPEDGTPVPVDLSNLWHDDDYDIEQIPANKPGWYVEGNTKSSIKISNQTDEMEITPLENAFGNEQVTLFLQDSSDLQDTIDFWVNITAENDEPFIGSPDADPWEGEAGDTFTFYVNYFDVEDEAPDFVKLKIDEDLHEMTPSDTNDQNYVDGAKYEVNVQLFKEDHDYYFVMDDGHGDVTSEKAYTTKWPKIIDVLRIKTAWSLNKEFMVKIGYNSKAGGSITINEAPTKPSNDTYPSGFIDVGFFYGVSTTIQNIYWIHMEFQVDPNNITGIFVNFAEVQLYYYDSSASKWNMTKEAFNDEIGGMQVAMANVTMDMSSEVIIAPLGLENNDVDDDGFPNDEDKFPFDPMEWYDNDGDGFGDNGDAFDNDKAASKDSDGDGSPDEWNPGMKQSDSTTGLYLDEYINDADCSRDLDEDETCDEKDDDRDGDGMPNQWEISHDLDQDDPSDADSDKDNDGYSALKEYQGGSDPNDKKSIPPKLDEDNGIDFTEGSNLIIIAVLIIVILLVVVAVMFRKPKKKDEPAPPAAPPSEAASGMEMPPQVPPAGVPPAETQVPPVPPAPEMPGAAPEQLPESGVPAALEGVVEQPPAEITPGEDFVADETQAESMTPQAADIIAEGDEAEDMIEDGVDEEGEEETEE